MLLSFFLLLTAVASALPAASWPGEQWPTTTPAQLGLDETKLAQARDYALTGEGSGCIIVQGKQVTSWGDQTALYENRLTGGTAATGGPVALRTPPYPPSPSSNASVGRPRTRSFVSPKVVTTGQ